MAEEDYKKLNDYLNDTFIYLGSHDGFFIQNMYTIFRLNSSLYEKYKNYDISVDNMYEYLIRILNKIRKYS